MSVIPILIILLFQSLSFTYTRSAGRGDILQAHYLTGKHDPASANINLFVIKRNIDNNIVVYDANLLPDKKLNPEQPVKVYWIRNTEGGIKKELSFLQKKMAYGLELKKVSDSYEGQIAAYEKKTIKIKPGPGGKPTAYIMINGKWQYLKQIYLHIKDGKAIIPKVSFIELFGKDIKTGADVVEKIML